MSLIRYIVMLLGIVLLPFLGHGEHALSLFGKPRYSKDFSHFSYVNKKAPKGGVVRVGMLGGFQGASPYDIAIQSPYITNLISCKLMSRSIEEPFTLYGQLAQEVTLPDDGKTLRFHIKKNGAWHSGNKITARSLKKLFLDLKRHSIHPQIKIILDQVSHIAATDEHLTFFLMEGSIPLKQLPFMIASLPLVKLNTPLQHAHCGPYKVSEAMQKNQITLKRVPQSWTEDLPTHKGRFNFDTIIFKFYGTHLSLLEAFKKGEVDYIKTDDPETWEGLKHFSKDHPETNLSSFPLTEPLGMEGFVFNTRSPLLNDVNVRMALALMLDFEWINTHFHRSFYKRYAGFFENVIPEQKNFPLYLQKLSKRERLQKAKDLLQKAGWHMRKGQLYSEKKHSFLTLTLLLPGHIYQKEAFYWAKSLKELGIKLEIKSLESSLFHRLKQGFQFDIIYHKWFFGHVPGSELLHYFSEKTASKKGSHNIAGIKNNKIDHILHQLLSIDDLEKKTDLLKALDQILLEECYVVPLFHMPKELVAHHKNLAYPKGMSLAPSLVVWWREGI